MDYKVHSITIGSKLHKNNEDACYVGDDCIIVADGMGGECNGDIASRIAIDTIVDYLSKNLNSEASETDIKETSFKAIEKADAKISEFIDQNPESFGMGTTVLLTIIRNDKLYISWCGDSHCYVYKDAMLSSITKDHSYVQQLIDSGNITVDEAFTHPNNNLITRFVGGGKDTCIPDFCSHQVSDSELIVLCSDGLSGYCKQNDVAKTIKSNRDIVKLPGQLSELALRRGSDDDITIVVVAPKSYKPRTNSAHMFEWLRKLVHV